MYIAQRRLSIHFLIILELGFTAESGVLGMNEGP